MNRALSAAFFFCLLGAAAPAAARKDRTEKPQLIRTSSPDGRIEALISVGDALSYTLRVDGKTALKDARLGLETAEAGDLAGKPKLESVGRKKKDRIVKPPNPLWNSAIHDRFNETEIQLESGLGIILRAADDGVSLRFVTGIAGPLTVTKEHVGFPLGPETQVNAAILPCPTDPKAPDCFHTEYERAYPQSRAGDLAAGTRLLLPAVFRNGDIWLALSEAEIFDYPGSWLQAGQNGDFELIAPPAPRTTAVSHVANYKFESVAERQSYLAAYPDGHREFPWRVIQIGRNEADLIGRDFQARLSDKSLALQARQDFSWVRPGFSTDEWIIDAKPGVDPATAGFTPGLNTATYKYYIDFVAALGFPYIMVDDGWSDPNDQTKLNANIDLKEVVRYGNEKGVRIILWASGWSVKQDTEGVLDRFKALGVGGIAMDFHQRDDVDMLRFQERVVKGAAERRLHMMLHGSSKPNGLNLRYPNLIAIEAGLGHEYDRWGSAVTPRHKLDLAMIRAIQGPIDYEGGSLRNFQPEQFKPAAPETPSQGTRANELALILALPSPLQVIAGDPAQYQADPEMMAFLKGLPTTWDETRVLKAEMGTVLVLARRKGDRWFLAALSALNEPRSLTLNLSFLPKGKYRLEGIADGPHAGVDARDYILDRRDIGVGRELSLDLARNGGWAGRIVPGGL